MPATISITGVSEITSAWRRRAFQAFVSRPHPAPDALQANRANTCRSRLPVAVQEEHTVLRKDLGFEFMMNALRLAEASRWGCSPSAPASRLTAVEPALAEAVQRGLDNA